MTEPFAVKTLTKSCDVDMRFYDSSRAYDVTMVSEIIIVAFDEEDRILVLKDKKGFAVLRGIIEWDDDTIEDAVRREVLEQACATLGVVRIAAIIETTPENAFAEDPVVTVVATARLETMEAFPANQEDKRFFLAKQDFLDHGAPENAEVQPCLMDLVEKTLGKRGEDFL